MSATSIANSPQVYAKVAGVFYLLTIVTGALAAVFVTGRQVNNFFATACYVAVTLLFYPLYRPVSRSLSFVAAAFSLAGCTLGALGSFGLAPPDISPLGFFGVYCLLIGYLTYRCTFLPRALGLLMAFGGLGWLTFLWPSLARNLTPYNMAPGVIGEAALTIWLLVKGIDVPKWKDTASAGGSGDANVRAVRRRTG